MAAESSAARTIKVLEIGGYGAGYAGRLFVRAGFDVVRIESTPAPAWASQDAMNAYLHAGKRRVSVAPETLTQAADIVICEAACADELSRLGFDEWATPIKVAITPFGRTGPKRNWRASPSVILAMGGYTHLMGDPDRTPLSLPGHYLEFQVGALGYSASLALLHAKRRDQVDIGMYETLMSLSQFTSVLWHCAGEVRSRHGSDFWSVAPSDLFRCADGWVYINIVPNFWDAFIALLGVPDLVVDDRFATNDTRMANRGALHDVIADALKDVPCAELDQRAATFRVPLGVVRTLEGVLGEPHLEQRAFWERTTVEDGRTVSSPGLPFNFDHRPRAGLGVSAVE